MIVALPVILPYYCFRIIMPFLLTGKTATESKVIIKYNIFILIKMTGNEKPIRNNRGERLALNN